jgi:RNA polymerase sigma factor (sigma-70 family)
MNSPDRAAGQKPSPRSAFPTTHWSVVRIAAGQETQEAAAAMEALCRQYWFPIYGFIRRQGRAHHEAEDLTQDFIARLLDRDLIGRAQPERGRFRTFLLTALRHFLTNEWYRSQTARAGGDRRGAVAAMLDFREANERFAREAMDAELTPEEAFDRAWALNVIERALASLREEYAASGRGALFEAVAPFVWGGGKPEPLAVAAQRFGMTEGALKVAVHRLRKRLREHVEELVAQTVEDTADAAAEVQHLVAAVTGSRRQVA